MIWVLLTEFVRFHEATAEGVLLGEAVRQAGLDPDVFIAVIPADCGRAGRLNLNNRIYDIGPAIAAHESLCLEATQNKNFGELNHPEDGPTWNVVSRFLGGSTLIESDGSALFRGRFAILNNTLGRDFVVAWKAGVPMGNSLRAEGLVEEHFLDEKSPYLKMNKGQKGKKANLVKEMRFHGYDHVRTPSAETFFPQAVQEAVRRLQEAAKGKEPHMSFKNFAALLAAHPEDAKAIREEIESEQRAKLEPQLTEAKQKAEEAKRELNEAKASATGKDDRLTEVLSLLKKAEERTAVAENKAKIVEALDKWMTGRHNGARIKAFVLDEACADPETALKRADRLADLMKGDAAILTGDPTKVTEAKDVGGTANPVVPKKAADELASL